MITRKLNLKGDDSWMQDCFISPFTVNGDKFMSVYQYLVYEKAKLFNRKDIISTIKRTTSVKDLVSLDHSINVEDTRFWRDVYNDCINIATIQKFACNDELRQKLIHTDYSLPYTVIGGRVDFGVLKSVQFIMQYNL